MFVVHVCSTYTQRTSERIATRGPIRWMETYLYFIVHVTKFISYATDIGRHKMTKSFSSWWFQPI